MQTIPTALANHLAQEVTTLATCWKITRTDGQVFRFTDHDVDITIGAEIYSAKSGITPTAVSSQLGLSTDNLELDGLLSDGSLQEADILSGKFDHAAVSIFMVNYTSPSDGTLPLKSGWLGEVKLQGGKFVAEIRGLTAALQQSIGQVYTATCRAKLGDVRCGVNLTSYTFTGTITATTSAFSFTDSTRAQANDYFAHGLVQFTSGANAGLAMEVREFTNKEFVLFLPMPYAMAVGDGYTVVAGCDKSFSSCIAKFSNAINFRGEPHVPGTDTILETATTRAR
ncbi:MAG: hypothetical protein B7X02_00915 [Rhodospirillales bacterium 12-54-5]|nr:MAG: hypothetical protein B7X02_00915 [Rhodospirillales bacterium 12-54-5]